MHRSGSSALSRAMTTLGIQHTSNLMNASEDNKKGYWEDNEFVCFNDDLLRRTGQLWEMPKLIKVDEILNLVDDLGEEASSFLNRKISSGKPTCLKDPRLCNLALFWKKICEVNSIKYDFIATYRDPLSTANSIKKRDNIDIEKGLSMWCTYYLNLLENLNCNDVIVVNYDELLDNTRYALEALSSSLGITLIEDELKIYSEQFLDIRLRHNDQALISKKPIEIISNQIKNTLDDLKAKQTDHYPNWSNTLNQLRNSLIEADPELSEESTASKLKKLFAVHYTKAERCSKEICEAKQDIHTLHSWLNESKQETQSTRIELSAIKKELQHTNEVLVATQTEFERIKVLRQAARKRYVEALEQFHSLTQTIWWRTATPLRLILSSRHDRANLRSLKSRISPETEKD
ncbi:sulfotransferase family protein [Synechococcus sp. MU1625]|uniref:sulfotransferase family protein n=1 Tax=Synechococcus sp. MU1625 TaxID=2508347 RepID=UPI001CF91C8C|nr:hypothetical protein [Synechococcus sp. MU1625]MCB4400498.1 hypothetical protein [Synechococcus sp. MU1625]